MIRNITGTGEGNGPMIAIHDGFGGTVNWAGFLHGADRLALGTLEVDILLCDVLTTNLCRHTSILRLQWRRQQRTC